MYLTGSKALDYLLGQRFDINKDWDIIADESELQRLGLSFGGENSLKLKVGSLLIEFLNIDFLNNSQICAANSNSRHVFMNLGIGLEPVNVLDIELLYIQKRSHIWRPLNFTRHIMELQRIKDSGLYNGLDQYYYQLLQNRISETKKEFKDRVPSLNQSNEDFFDDAVKKYYVHDDLHKVMAFYDEPIYERLKVDKTLAKCEKELWVNLLQEDKIKCVVEECCVIAVERFLIPKLEFGERYMPEKMAFNKALEKVCTTLTSGWFRDFAIDNWKDIKKFGESVSFYSKFSEALKSGELKHV
jgi:hypothetical protein